MPSTSALAAAAKLIAVGFKGTEPTPGVIDLLRRGVTGCVLFGWNLPDPLKVRELTGALKAARGGGGGATLLALDQEGGRVRRLRGGPFTHVPPMRAVGATGDVTLAADAGRVLGREVRAAGFDLDFAPVVDVDTNPLNPVIADRSFGADPALVSRMATALIKAMQSEAGGAIGGCAKHFPGHGDTKQDSHHDLPRLDHDLARLESVELPPFKAAIDAGVSSVMSAHVVFSPLDPDYPATMSRKSLGDLLRWRFGFDGVLFSDDLEMKALAGRFPLEDQLLRGVEAGIDLFLICHSEDLQRQAIEILAAHIERGTITPERLAASHRRIDRLLAAHVRPLSTETPDDVRRDPAHAAASARLERLATEVAEGKDPTRFRG